MFDCYSDDDILNLVDIMDYVPDRYEFREEFWEYEAEYSDGNIEY